MSEPSLPLSDNTTKANCWYSADAFDPENAFLAIPHYLVLQSSCVTDVDGASLFLRVLSPPPDSKKTRPWLRTLKSASEEAASTDAVASRRKHLQAALEGPFSKLKLTKLEARFTGSVPDAEAWVARLNQSAYVHPVTQEPVKAFKKLRVLVNPAGGPGKARKLFESRIRPVLEAAGCKLTTTFTTHRYHGFEICQTEKDLAARFDAIVCVSGDGMVHEVLNGLASRPDDAKHTLDNLPVAPIPTGSGNATSVCLLGPKQGFNLALACLSVIKGLPLQLAVCTVTQVEAARQKENSGVAELPEAAAYKTYYSFLSQAIGLMADVDIGTEHMRALGDARFVLGYLQGIVSHNKTPVRIDVKLGEKGTLNRAEMRARMFRSVPTPSANGTISNAELPTLRHGTVVDHIAVESVAPLDIADPSWERSKTLARGSADSGHSGPTSAAAGGADGWHRIVEPVSSLYAGTLPYVARDLLQFPFAKAGDGTIDLVLMLHDGGRISKIRTIGGAEDGTAIYDKSVAYIKVEAFRVTPLLPQGSKQLKGGGIISIDGEQVPYTPFQVEITEGLNMKVLSLYGQFVAPVVEPPTSHQKASKDR